MGVLSTPKHEVDKENYKQPKHVLDKEIIFITFVNSEDIEEMLQNASFHQGLQLRKTIFISKESRP